MESKEQLEKRLAQLESANDQLVSELQYIDHLMRLVGFTDGIHSLKDTAHDFYEKGDQFLEENH